MTPPIRTDEVTGLKSFNTRAAKATEKIAGKGYSPTSDEALTTLPPPPAGATFNAEEQAKYRAYKEARQGAADYITMEGEFARYLEDVYSAPANWQGTTGRYLRNPGDRGRLRRADPLVQVARRRISRRSCV
jgi:hypothetical protein